MEKKETIVKSKPQRVLLIICGTISLALGIIGIAIPVLPTTPFLLLAAACYARSSERFYNWLMSNRVFGSYIRNYREGRGIPVRVKAMAITFLWATILVSMYLVENTVMRVVLPIISIAVTAHILSLKTMQEKSK
jgi:uncharacterized membrane protein YbaN (DUF454 family)